MTFTLTSTAFADQGEIPPQYTCDGDDRSPPLAWEGVPNGTQSLALIVDDPDAPDPDAPKMTWVHWVIYNILTSETGLPEGVTASNLPAAATEGLNDWEQVGYRGPCPPIGRHRYFHKLYALDTMLPDLDTPTKTQLESAMADHILGQATLMGTYQK